MDREANEKEALAERNVLLELLGVAAHDLSNPLQSLTVLTELGVDEPGATAEQRHRAEQCLEAAERMRQLVLALAGLARTGTRPGTIGQACTRLGTLLARRFDRHQLRYAVQLESLAGVTAPVRFELGLCSLLLGALEAVEGPPAITGATVALQGGADARRLRVELTGPDGQRIEPAPAHVANATAILDEAGIALRPGSGGWVMELTPVDG